MIPWREWLRIRRCPALAEAAALLVLAVLLGGGWIMTEDGVARATVAQGTLAHTMVVPDQASRLARDGQDTIIDIHWPDEWQETGVPSGAKRATIHSRLGSAGFLNRIATLTKRDKTTPVALICAAGVRSKHAGRLLRGHGYTQVLDISEGMLGNGKGAGWIGRKLPLNPCPDCK